MINASKKIVLATRAGHRGAKFRVGHCPTHGDQAAGRPEQQDYESGLDIEQLEAQAGEHACTNHIGDYNGRNRRKFELRRGHESGCFVRVLCRHYCGHCATRPTLDGLARPIPWQGRDRLFL